MLVQSERNEHAALKLMRKLLKKYAFVPEQFVTDDLRLYGAAARALGLERLHQSGRWRNNRAENSHQRTDGGSARCNVSRALALLEIPRTHAAVYNIFNVQRHLIAAQTHRVLRAAAMTTWREVVAAA